MRIPIDGAGRVVIPKELRERLGLVPGMRLDVGADAEGRIVLVPVREESALVEEQGILVYGGEATGELPDARDLRRSWLERAGGPRA